MAVHEWTVAGGLIETDAGVLLVRNVRRGGSEDWSTPGGVIDADDVDLLAGLTREVEEETGLRVREWTGPLYEVRAFAPDMGWRMRCEVHRAVAFDGELRVEGSTTHAVIDDDGKPQRIPAEIRAAARKLADGAPESS